ILREDPGALFQEKAARECRACKDQRHVQQSQIWFGSLREQLSASSLWAWQAISSLDRAESSSPVPALALWQPSKVAEAQVSQPCVIWQSLAQPPGQLARPSPSSWFRLVEWVAQPERQPQPLPSLRDRASAEEVGAAEVAQAV